MFLLCGHHQDTNDSVSCFNYYFLNLTKNYTLYYIIDNETNSKVVGIDYPQVDCYTMDQAHLISAWKLLEPQPNLEFELKKRCKLTDVLSDATIGGGSGFLINDKIRNILNKFHLMSHQYLDASIKTKDNLIQQYYWLHLTEPELILQLDYKKTEFYRTEFMFREEPIKLDSYEHYENFKSKDTEASFGVGIEKIALSDSFDKSLDLFTFLPFDNNIYISKKLKKAIEENNVIGFKIREATNFI